ncbi:MAG: inositol monophosphatase [Firmicutes bacterium]|nr:inositol monophosphatase [Bacillota bacterium]
MEEYLSFAIGIAKYAGELMREYFKKENGIEFKEDRTPVTYVDKTINNYLINEVKKNYPKHSVDGEEEKYIVDSNFVWVCDPVDGTSMYTRGIPVSVFSLALVVDGEVVVGVVYDPFLDDMYTAIKGQGAYCNGKKLQVNSLDLGDLGCSVDYSMWNNAKYDTLDLVREIRSDAKICQIGSVAHAAMAVASGKISAEVFPGTSHGHCDIAASKLIVEEAGGIVSNFHGEDQRYDEDIDGAIISNEVIHKNLVKKITDIYDKPKMM